MRIGPYELPNVLALAPMAGVTDRPFRMLARSLGAGLAASEMVSADPRLWDSAKTRHRVDHRGEGQPRIVQIAGADPQQMADAARRNVDAGAQIIDINMGCPAKKVCNRLAGSALLQDEPLVGRILAAVVAAVDVPVTLKTRTGWTPARRNGVSVARLAERCGIAALAVHGRTRACMYRGDAEYETIAEIKNSVSIPVYANGDIDSAHKAAAVLRMTGADGLMIGRAAQGQPWLFREIAAYLRDGTVLAAPSAAEVRDIMQRHLDNLYSFYGEHAGVRIARKHLTWYCQAQHADVLRREVLRTDSAHEQLRLIREYFDRLSDETGAALLSGEGNQAWPARLRRKTTPARSVRETSLCGI